MIVEVFSFLAEPARAALEGRHDDDQRPLRRPRAAHVRRHRLYGVVALVGVAGVLAWVIWRFYDDGQFEGDKWEVFVTPDYVRRHPGRRAAEHAEDGRRRRSLGASVLGFVLGVGKLSDHAWVRWPAWVVVEFFRAIPVLLLMVFVWYVIGIEKDGSSFWAVVIALTLYNGSVLAEVLRAGVLRGPEGAARGGVRDRHAQDPGHEHRADAAGGQDHAAGDHQPVHRRAQGHRAGRRRAGARPDQDLQADLPASSTTGCRP